MNILKLLNYTCKRMKKREEHKCKGPGATWDERVWRGSSPYGWERESGRGQFTEALDFILRPFKAVWILRHTMIPKLVSSYVTTFLEGNGFAPSPASDSSWGRALCFGSWPCHAVSLPKYHLCEPSRPCTSKKKNVFYSKKKSSQWVIKVEK